MNPHYPQVASRAGHRCEYCHAPEIAFNVVFEVEHIVPPNARGSTALENLALACRSCNVNKSDHTTAADPETSEVVRLFNPRSDEWQDHFFVQLDESIHGVTAIGRATVNCLKLNSSRQVSARLRWRMLKLFP